MNGRTKILAIGVPSLTEYTEVIMDASTTGKQGDLLVALLGDSVLDNFHWLSRPEQDVRQQLEDRLMKVAHLELS